MLQTLLKFGFFIGLGIAWRYTMPMRISAEAIQRVLIALLYTISLPALVLLVLWQSKFGGSSWKILLVMLLTVGVTLSAAWFYYKNKAISGNVKGVMILAATFGSILVIGMPLSQEWVARWTVRTAVYYEAVIMLPILFTVGVLIAKRYGENQSGIFGSDLVKQPIIIAMVLGIALNLAQVKMPVLVSNWLNIAKLGILPISLIVVGLSLNWQKQWSRLMPAMLPAVILQLIIQPLLLWGFFHLFQLTGAQTFKSMIMQAAMPAMVLGFVICERYRLDTSAYSAVFSLSVVLSFITIPVWWTLLQRGVILPT